MNDIVPEGFGATFLSPQISSYSDLVYRTKLKMGYPTAPIELTDEQWAHIIDEAIETWTQFEGGKTEQYLMFCSNLYENGCGVKLDDLVQIGCNVQHCYQNVVTETVTSTNVVCETIETKTAYLSVSPWVYPTKFDYTNPYSAAFSGTSAQFINIYFDPKNPWKAQNVCQADCITINPVSSQWFQLSSNPNLVDIIFDFVNDSVLSNVMSAISANITDYPLSAVPLTAMHTSLTAIPISFYPLSAFYPPNINIGPPVSACLNIGQGYGYVYPNCNLALVNSCSALTSQFGITPSMQFILTSIPITSVEIETSSVNFSSISAYFDLFCHDCNCNCQFLSSFNVSLSSYTFELTRPVLSGETGVWDLSSRNAMNASHLILNDIPTCTDDGSIPILTNDGIVISFVLCNSAFSTSGPMTIENVQFIKDFKPPVEVLYDQRCGWNNNGFTMSYYNSGHSDCSRYTPEKVKVDVSFCKQNITTEIGTVSTVLSGNYDYGIGRKRKVLGVFEVYSGSEAGYGGFGGDLLFNFDYALMASTFGYDLQGMRNNLGRTGYDLLTYHLAKSFVETSKKMLRYVSYQFDPHTQYLKITPAPISSSTTSSGGSTGGSDCCTRKSNMCWIAGLYMEPDIVTCLNEYWVKEYVMAKAAQTLGFSRSTFTGVVLFGGVQLQGESLFTYATSRIEALIKELRDEARYASPALFFVG